jgi:hypothetical protein
MNELIQYPPKQQALETANRFSNCCVSEKILYTSFLVVIGVGYLVALVNMYCTYESYDGKAGFSIEDVIVKYHGSQTQTRLAIAINGIMEKNVKSKDDKDSILKWVEKGATEIEYNDTVAPILNRDCVACHNPAINPSLPNLTTYKTTAELAQIAGTPLPTLLRVAHIHLFGISIILVFIGKIFLLSEMNKIAKRIMVALPFIAMVLDVAFWFETRVYADFAYAIVAAGTLLGLSIGLQILVCIYQLWFLPKNRYLTTSIYE